MTMHTLDTRHGPTPHVPAGTLRAPRRASLRAPLGAPLRAFQAALAVFFLLGGAASLADVPALGVDFELLTDLTGAGAWLRLTAGSLEVLGAALLLMPAAPAGVGAVLVGALMAVAAAAYVAVLHAPPVLPLTLLGALAAVAYARRDALTRVGAFLVRNL